MSRLIWVIFTALASLCGTANAAVIEAVSPGLAWGVPFAGLLLSIALFPLVAPRFWHRRMGLVAGGWILVLIGPLAVMHGTAGAAQEVWHAILIEYLPFVALLLALFTAGGGILLEGGPWGTPGGNTLLLAIGTVLAGVMGTTGVSMVLIHPLLRANAHRRRRVHLVVFFILLCANAGGATSPLGDPPLYIGFLRGVPFFWPLQALILPLLVLMASLLATFFLIDRHLARRDAKAPAAQPLRLSGWPNVALVAVVVVCVLMQGLWHPGEIAVLGQPIEIERVMGMAVFALVTFASLRVTPSRVREGNLFSWEPMAEVGKLFAAIFITIGPVLAMLAAGHDGPLAFLIDLTNDTQGRPSPVAYFWVAGLLSAFLDNAPTYLVFFQTAGDDPALLTGELARVLAGLSAGAVFFGALTYIGNAPNMMVRSIAARRGIRMPGFFNYIGWSAAILLPVFALLTVLFFR
jgi:Na+/H+ antiporter NhaD/arsenite permease-like protein